MGSGKLQPLLNMITASKPFHPQASTSTSSKAKDSRDHLFDETQERCEAAGLGAEILEHGKFFSKKEWQNLLDGYTPDRSQKIVQNADDPSRQSYVDFTIAAPKSVSTFFAAASSEIRAEIIECHKTAVLSALDHFQECAALSRRTVDGVSIYERVAILWALHLQIESQALDPHLHTHCGLIGVGFREDGTTGQVRTKEFFEEIKAANAIYETELARQLQKRLGLAITPLDRGGFKIEGVPDELCKEFSKRRSQIENEVQRREAKNPKAYSYAAKSTRPDKTILSHEALYLRWQKTAKDFGFGEEKASELVLRGNALQAEPENAKAEFAEAAKKVPKSHRNKLIEFVRKAAIAHGASGGDLRDAFREHLPKREKLVRVEWKEAFKKAPFWSPAKLVKAPVIVIGNPKTFRRWGNILRERNSSLGKARIQEKFIFPNAPRWSPFHTWKLPALRYGKMRLTEKELWAKTHAKKNLGIGELRIQQRRVFPRALPWNPAKDMKVPVVRFVPKSKSQGRDTRNAEAKQYEHTH